MSLPASVPTEATQGRRGPGLSEDAPGRPVPPFVQPPNERAMSEAQRRVRVQRAEALAEAKRSGVPQEVVSARTSKSTDFANADGTTTTRFFQETAFVWDLAVGGLRSVDATLERRLADGRFVPVAAADVEFSTRR